MVDSRPGLARAAIEGFLTRCRAVIYRREAMRAALHAIAALGAVALALPVTAYLARESRLATLAMLSIGGLVAILVVVSAVVIGVVAPRRTYRGDGAVARWVGQRHRSLASDLLSSVQLETSPTGNNTPSPILVGALRDQIAPRIEAIDPRALLSPRSFGRARAWALGIVVANAAVAAIAPTAIASGWRRLAAWPKRPFDGAELSAVPLVGDLEIVLTAPSYAKRAPTTLASTSGDLRGLPGTAVKFRARALIPAASAELIVETGADGAAKTIAAAVDDAGHISAELTVDRAAHYRFAITSSSGARTVEAVAHSIDAEIDQAPVVQLIAPGDPLDVSNVKRVELGYAIEDDFAVTSAELVWEAGPRAGAGGGVDHGKKPLPIGHSLEDASPRIQGKLTWDIAEVNALSGGEIRYWIEAKDNDSVTGPNIGKSREFHLRVVSPRARHEAALERAQQIAAQFLANLGTRLSGPGDDLAVRDELSRQLRDAIADLRSVAATFEKDPHASDLMRKTLAAMSDRLEHIAGIEQRAVRAIAPKAGKAKPGAFAATDGKLVAELEDDVIALADWLDRERVESLLDIADEASAHQRRLAELLAQYARTKDQRLQPEIDRELRALERAYGELATHRSAMPEDVLDQYIHRDAAKPELAASCIAEVAALVHSSTTAAAQAKLEVCRQQQQRSAASLEGSLARVRSDKFSDEQAKLDEVMNELADVAKDQDDIAAESGRIFDNYAHKARELARDHRREASKTIGSLVDKVRRRIASIDEVGLTPFAKEELDIVSRRITDLERMVGDGDLAEALDMARQAKASLDTIASELASALSDDPKSKWVDETREALDGIDKTQSLAKELIDDLAALSPRPEEIMSSDDQRAFERLRRRQGTNEQRAKRLGERTKQLGGELPGDASRELGKKLSSATEHMTKATERMKSKDPPGARASTRAAADELAKARDRTRSAARQAQRSAVEDEPIRIPGADEYKASRQFREDLLEAMKHKSAKAPEGYDLLIKRYYEDLAK